MALVASMRKTYDAVALFSVLNVLVLAGFIAYLVGGGVLDGDKVQAIAAVMRGDAAEPMPGEEKDDADAPQEGMGIPDEGPVSYSASQIEREILQRESQRFKEELKQRLALNNSILLRISTEREAFRAERENAAKRDSDDAKRREGIGFSKQMDIYNQLAPRVAVQHLLAMENPDDAASVLLQIPSKKAKKIVEAAKRGDDLTKMMEVLRRVRKAAPARANAITKK